VTLRRRLQSELEKLLPDGEATWLTRLWGKLTGAAERRKAIIMRRIAAATALSQIEAGSFAISAQYWSMPYGEPEWVTVPAGEFWMGDDQGGGDEKPAHRLFVPEFRIARTPVTNTQYQLYIQATGAEPPRYWEDGRPPKEGLNHPVVYVSWEDACRYCEWLSKVTGKHIRLPTETEWEKAARGDKDRRVYPWGDEFDVTKCNSWELGLQGTSPVGLFVAGASLYKCLDMSGDVWEWVQDWYVEGYYQRGSDRSLTGPDRGEYKAVRGGSWLAEPRFVRVSFRFSFVPGYRDDDFGFRCAQ